VRLRDISDDIGLLAVQGPRAEALMQPLADLKLAEIGYYRHAIGQIAGVSCFLSRTGYTGEDGFELYCRGRDTVQLWDALTAAGAKPIGLGARDSLRLEMGYALYGNDIDRDHDPLSAGLGWTVALAKGDFVGRDRLVRIKSDGPVVKLVGLTVADGVARHGYPVLHDGALVGTSRPSSRRRARDSRWRSGARPSTPWSRGRRSSRARRCRRSSRERRVPRARAQVKSKAP
jgi:aminomethyltransferase